MTENNERLKTIQHRGTWAAAMLANLFIMFPCGCLTLFEPVADAGSLGPLGLRLLAATFIIIGLTNYAILLFSTRKARTESWHRRAATKYAIVSVVVIGSLVLAALLVGDSDFWRATYALVFVQFATASSLYLTRIQAKAEKPICANCDYPLIGLPPGTPCPECGSSERVSVD